MNGSPLLRAINAQNPINAGHPLNRGLCSRWQVLPQIAGTSGFGSGTWKDLASSSTNGRNNGTLTNGPTWTPFVMTRPGGSGWLSFDGTDDLVNCGSPAGLPVDGEVTFAFWYWPLTTPAGNEYIVNRGAGPSAVNWAVLRASTGKLAFRWAAANQLTSTATPTNGTPLHCLFTRSGSTGSWTAKIYFNVFQDSTASTATDPFSTAYTLSFGARTDAGGTAFHDCLLDDIRVWDRALSAEEVAAVYRDSFRGSPETLNWITRTRRIIKAAAAASFKSAWARNSNTVIQAGGRCA